MRNYANEVIEFNGCPGCCYANHEFILPCGMAYENDNLTLSQDWEIPIPGFFIASPKRCVEKFENLSMYEKMEIFDVVDKTIKILRNNNICERFNVLFEEKENRHFHIWIMPRYEWMNELVGDIIDNIGVIFEYAKENMRTNDNFEKIQSVTNILKENFNDYNVGDIKCLQKRKSK